MSVVDDLRNAAVSLRGQVEALETGWTNAIKTSIGSDHTPIKNFLKTYLDDKYHKRSINGNVIGKQGEINGHDNWLRDVTDLTPLGMVSVYLAPDYVVVNGEDMLAAGGRMYQCVWRDSWRLVDPNVPDGWRCIEVLEMAAVDVTPVTAGGPLRNAF